MGRLLTHYHAYNLQKLRCNPSSKICSAHYCVVMMLDARRNSPASPEAGRTRSKLTCATFRGKLILHAVKIENNYGKCQFGKPDAETETAVRRRTKNWVTDEKTRPARRSSALPGHPEEAKMDKNAKIGPSGVAENEPRG